MGHDNTTNTSELMGYGKTYFGKRFLGVFPQDKLPNKIYKKNNTDYAIVNVDTKCIPGSDPCDPMPGTHWVAVAGLPNQDRVMIFDSFGRDTKQLLPLLYKQGKTLDTGHDAEQKKMQDSCGQFSLAWLVLIDQYGHETAQLI